MNKFYATQDTVLFRTDGDTPCCLECATVALIQFAPVKLLHIRGVLPMRRDLLEIEDGAAFEIRYTECGDRSSYCNGVPLFRFTDCKAVKRYMENSVDCEGHHVVSVDLILSCEIETPDWRVS